jgi:hypothetical protein
MVATGRRPTFAEAMDAGGARVACEEGAFDCVEDVMLAVRQGYAMVLLATDRRAAEAAFLLTVAQVCRAVGEDMGLFARERTKEV